MLKFFRKLAIRYQLVFIAILTVAIMCIIIFITYVQTSAIVVKKNKEYTSEMIHQVYENINSNCEQINKIITSVAYDKVIQDFLVETDTEKKYVLSRSIDNLFENITYLRDDIYDIVIIGKNGNVYSRNGNSLFVEGYQAFLESQKKPNYTGIIPIDSINIQGKTCILLGMPVYSTNADYLSRNNIGCVALILNPNMFESSIKSIQKTSTKFYLLDRNLNIINSNDTNSQGSHFSVLGKNQIENDTETMSLINGERNIIQTQKINIINGVIVSITLEQSLLAEISNLRLEIIVIFLISLILVSIPFFFAVNNILQPIKSFMSFMSSIKTGSLKTLKRRIILDGYSEMSIMAGEFNQMLDEIDELTHNLLDTNSLLYRVELEKKQAELDFLQSQINPHFLYNTIESIKSIAKIKGVPEIYEMTKSLGRILRYGVKGADEVMLKEELDIIESYIMIQKTRFKDRFDIFLNISAETLDCIVPKMILQPVVENAIYHGLEPNINKGSLSISSEIDQENTLVITIRDDGVGMDKEALAAIRDRICKLETGSLSMTNVGIGIINVNNRIKLKYGIAYGITIESELEKGTTVVLQIPSRRDSNV